MSVAETMKATTDCAKKLIEAPRYNVGDFVGVYEYETDVRIHDIRWEGSCFVYKVYLADEETWLYDDDIAYKTDEMIEGLVEKSVSIDVAVEETTKDISDKAVDTIMGGLIVGKSFNLPQGYIFKDENGNVINATKIVLEKKKKEYPKSFGECCKVLGTYSYNQSIVGYKNELFSALQKLIICRDAYWKIAGEEMGLGKPWEPSGNENCFVISRSCGEVFLYEGAGDSEPFEFPTPEMRNAFKKNFDPDIEICKELL